MLESVEKISIILPSFNYDSFISEAIESVLKQSYKDWELIIVDDGSIDNSPRVIEKYIKKCDKIKLIFHPNKENKGLVETYRLGLKHCEGNYIAFIEADDIWAHSDYLSSKIDIFKRHKDVILVHNDVQPFGNRAEDKKNIIREDRKIYKIKERPFYAFKYLSVWNYVYTFSCFVVRAELLKNHVKISNKFSDVWLDWWVLGQLSVQGKFFFQPEKKTKWRIHDKSYNFVSSQIRPPFGSIPDTKGTIIEKCRSNIISHAVGYLNKEGNNTKNG